MNMKRLVCSLLLALGVLNWTPCAQQSDESNSLSTIARLREIAAKHDTAWKRITAYNVTYDYYSRLYIDPSLPGIPSLMRPQMIGEHVQTHQGTRWCKGDLVRVDERHTGMKSISKHMEDVIPDEVRIQAVDNAAYCAHIMTGGKLSNRITAAMRMHATDFPFSHTGASRITVAAFPPQFESFDDFIFKLNNLGTWKITENPGQPIHVVFTPQRADSNAIEFWIEPTRGHMLTRYVVHETNGFEREVYENTFQEAEEGVWFPKSHSHKMITQEYGEKYTTERRVRFGKPVMNPFLYDSFFTFDRFELDREKLQLTIQYSQGKYEEYLWHNDAWVPEAQVPKELRPDYMPLNIKKDLLKSLQKGNTFLKE